MMTKREFYAEFFRQLQRMDLLTLLADFSLRLGELQDFYKQQREMIIDDKLGDDFLKDTDFLLNLSVKSKRKLAKVLDVLYTVEVKKWQLKTF